MLIDRSLISLLRSRYAMLFIVILAGFLAGVLVVFQARIMSIIVNSIYLDRMVLRDVEGWLLILLIFIILRGMLIWIGDYAARSLAIKIKTELRELLVDHLDKLGPSYLRTGIKLKGGHTGEIVQVVNQGVEELLAYYGQYIPQLALAVLVPLTILVFILPVDTLSAMILLFTAPLIPLFMVLIGDRAKVLTEKQWTTLSRMSAYFLDVIQGLGTLKIFARSRDQIQIIQQIGGRYRSTTMGVLRITFLSALALEWLAMLSTAVIAVEISLRLLYGRLSFEQAFFVLLLTPEFYLPLRLLGSRFHAGMAGVAAAGEIFAILNTQPKMVYSFESTPSTVIKEGSNNLLSVEFDEVSFAYGEDTEILSTVSFEIPAGKTTALVGPSGTGKSTIIELILGFIQPQKGQILVNQQPLQSLAGKEWMAQIAWVSQNPYIFNTTVMENVRLANPGANHEQVITACQNANAHNFISILPQGYQTILGERGARLSAGQAQRIALARAYLKDAPLLILDEATANLDPRTVQEVNSILRKLAAGRTVLIAAHNLATVISADQIIVLKNGSVAERGSHDQLMAMNGFYRSMLIKEKPLPAVQPADHEKDIPRAPGDLLPTSQPSVIPVGEISLVTLGSLIRMQRPFKWRVLLSILLGSGTVLSGVGLMATSAYLISAAALQISIAVMQVPIVAVRAFGIARGLFRYLERYVTHDNTFRLINHIRVWFYQALEPLAPARLQHYQSGDLLNRIRQDMRTLEDFYVRVISPPMIWILVTLATFGFLTLFSIQLGLVLILFQTFAGFSIPLLVRYISRKPERSLVDKQAELTSALVDGIQGRAEIRVFDQSGSQAALLQEINRSLAKLQLHLGRISSLVGAAGSTLAQLASWIVLLLAIPMVSNGDIAGVFLGSLILATLASFEAALPLPQSAQVLERGLAAARRLGEIVSTSPEVSNPASPIPSPVGSHLELKRLNFAYSQPDEEHHEMQVLRDISFDLPAGKRLAIVGPSGAGKTTLVNLLLRFWEYHQGNIFLENKEFRGYLQEDIRDQLSVIQQRTFLFNGTLRDNLRLAKPGASQEELNQVCQHAQLNDLLITLPDGFDTWIGEAGARLSAGERQRLAIARALLKDSPILLLDEPTAYLDTLTEEKLVADLLKNFPQTSVLWITHRLVGMPIMDEILVLDGGQIVERGRHQELLDQGGLYREMWDLQHQLI